MSVAVGWWVGGGPVDELDLVVGGRWLTCR